MIGVEGLYYPKTQSFPAAEKQPLRTKGVQLRVGYPYNENGTIGILGNMVQHSLAKKPDSINIKGKTFGIWQRNNANIANVFNTFYEFQLGYKDLNIKAKGAYVSVNGGLSAEIFPHCALEIWASLLQYQIMWDAKKEAHKDFSLGGLLGGGISAKF
jgi:hypothetical protein